MNDSRTCICRLCIASTTSGALVVYLPLYILVGWQEMLSPIKSSMFVSFTVFERELLVRVDHMRTNDSMHVFRAKFPSTVGYMQSRT